MSQVDLKRPACTVQQSLQRKHLKNTLMSIWIGCSTMKHPFWVSPILDTLSLSEQKTTIQYQQQIPSGNHLHYPSHWGIQPPVGDSSWLMLGGYPKMGSSTVVFIISMPKLNLHVFLFKPILSLLAKPPTCAKMTIDLLAESPFIKLLSAG